MKNHVFVKPLESNMRYYRNFDHFDTDKVEVTIISLHEHDVTVKWTKTALITYIRLNFHSL